MGERRRVEGRRESGKKETVEERVEEREGVKSESGGKEKVRGG